jgi:hypothetical protein
MASTRPASASETTSRTPVRPSVVSERRHICEPVPSSAATSRPRITRRPMALTPTARSGARTLMTRPPFSRHPASASRVAVRKAPVARVACKNSGYRRCLTAFLRSRSALAREPWQGFHNRDQQRARADALLRFLRTCGGPGSRCPDRNRTGRTGVGVEGSPRDSGSNCVSCLQRCVAPGKRGSLADSAVSGRAVPID